MQHLSAFIHIIYIHTYTHIYIYICMYTLYRERSLLNIFKSERQRFNLGAFIVVGYIAGMVLNAIY